VQFTVVGKGGRFTADEFRAAIKPRGHIVLPPTGLVAIENTHNMGGGIVFPQAEAVAVCAAARAADIASYLDGARLFNAATASGLSFADLARPFDLASVALSKGLGCPVGSVLAGSKATIAAGRTPAGALAGRCGNRASSPPPGSTRSTTMSRGSRRITPMRGFSPSASPGSPASASISRRCSQHRDLGDGCRTRPTRRRSSLAPRQPAC
jgi:hypothetical protein